MNHTILIHGMEDSEASYKDPVGPSASNSHWFPWLQHQLLIHSQLAQTPEMPTPYEPQYGPWSKVFEQFKISNETTLVGHSCGGGFLIRYLSEHPELTPKRVILVAPWIDPEPHELEEENDFFHFEIDTNLTSRTDLHVFISSDDDKPMIRTAEIIECILPNTTWYRYTDKGHFCEGDLGTKAFPELLETILK